VDDSQRIDGVDSVFDRSARVFSLEGEGSLHRVIENVTLGGEALYYRNDFRRGNNLHTLYTAAYLLKVKYYFRPGKDWRPYLGAGFGTAISNDLYGPMHGHAEGAAFQGVVGMQWRVTDSIGGRLEYMHLSARETHSSGDINASARALFVGVSVFFGRR
jgi:opacity protein-like surface antigen